MLFRQLVLSAAIVLAISGCSDQPSGSDSTSPGNGSGNGTTSDSSTTPGSPAPPSTQPGSGGNVTPPALPTSRSTLTISGPVAGSQKTDTYAFKVCSGQVCEQWQSTVEEGGFEYTFQLSQWPHDQIVTVEGSKLTTTPDVISARAYSAANIDANSPSYFMTELDSLRNMLKLDSNDDGLVDELEVPSMSLDPVTLAFNTVAKYLLDGELSRYNNLPYQDKYEAVRSYLSENSKTTLLDLTEEQQQNVNSHVASQGRFKKYFGNYVLPLSAEQWLSLNGDPNIPDEQKAITLNTSQIRTIHNRDNDRKATYKQLSLTVAQTYTVQKKLVFNQQLVIELAALYQLLGANKSIEVVLSEWRARDLEQQISVLNPGDGEATRFEGTYTIPATEDTLEELGLSDRINDDELTLQIDANTMREVYQNAQNALTEGKSGDYVFSIKPMRWPTGENTRQHIGSKVLEKAVESPSQALWQHYESQFTNDLNAINTYPELAHAFSSDEQKTFIFQRKVQELVLANHKHPFKNALLSLAPIRYLRISGRFPKELEQASLSIVLGSRPNPELGGYYDKGLYPLRHQPVGLINGQGQRLNTLDLTGKNDFVTTIALRDIDNFYSRCNPGKPYENGEEYTADEMQDTLTIHLRDNKTSVELRSVLGSFCEIAKLDEQQGNNNGILEHTELERLNVGYVSTAQAALLLKQSVSSYGTNTYIFPWKHEEIVEKYRHMPRKQIELLAAFAALQAKGQIFGSMIDLVERGSFYDDLLALINIDMAAKYNRITDNNTYPEVEYLQERLAVVYSIVQLLIENLDLNISHITQEMISLLSDSNVDSYYFPKGVRPGSWVTVYPTNGLDPTCQSLIQENQLLGLRIEGRGRNEAGSWVTIGWDTQPGATNYTLGWDEKSFTQIAHAQHVVSTEKLRTTISGLASEAQYYIRVQSNSGSPSTLMTYVPNQLHIADSRVKEGINGDDSTRGRDNSLACDLLTGLAQNSDKDGILGARYLKLDNQGKPLVRQDLSYSQQPFACVLDAHTGLVWETKHNRREEDDYSIYDNDNTFVMDASGLSDTFNGTCTSPDTNNVLTDPKQCTVKNQIKWVNNNKRCGLDNWRLPKLQEGYGLIDFGKNRAQNIDERYFPNLRNVMWLDSPSIDGKKYRTLNPYRIEANFDAIILNKPLMLVSDGFNTND